MARALFERGHAELAGCGEGHETCGGELESGGLRAYRPKEVWAIEEEDGFIQALEIVRDDDTKEIVRVRRQAIRRAD